MLTKKRIIKAIFFFLLVTCTPIQDYIFPPSTLLLQGTVPPGTKLEAVTSYYTKSPLCRSFSMGSGSFMAHGTSSALKDTTADASGHYTLDVPLENKSLFCDWTRHGIYLYAYVPRDDFSGSGSVNLARMFKDSTAPAEAVTMQCAKTYFVAYQAPGTPRRNTRILCRNTNLPFPENASNIQFWPEVLVPEDAQELTLNMLLQDGPVYDLRKGPAQFWRNFDAEQAALREEQDAASAGKKKPVKIMGTYSHLAYAGLSWDLSGTQITLIPSAKGYYALVEPSENWPARPHLVPAQVEENKVTFTLSSPGQGLRSFEGTIQRLALQGAFSNTDQQLTLKRQRSYWEDTPPSLHESGCYSDVPRTTEAETATGHQLFITYGEERYHLLYQRLSGQPEPPMLLPIAFSDRQVKFAIPREGAAPREFNGQLTEYDIRGSFNDSEEIIKFKRQECYWQ